MQYGVGALEHPSDFLACLPVDFAADITHFILFIDPTFATMDYHLTLY